MRKLLKHLILPLVLLWGLYLVIRIVRAHCRGKDFRFSIFGCRFCAPRSGEIFREDGADQAHKDPLGFGSEMIRLLAKEREPSKADPK